MTFDRQLGFFSQDRTRIPSREPLPHPPAQDHAWVRQPGRTIRCQECGIQARDANEVVATCQEMLAIRQTGILNSHPYIIKGRQPRKVG